MHSFFRLSGIFLATLLSTSSLSSPTLVGASAPMAKKAAPGFYRLRLGKFEVTALSDGTFDFPVKDLLTNVSPSDLDEALAKSFLTSPYQMSINGFLVNTGGRLVLIDAGLGVLPDKVIELQTRFGRSDYGHLSESLRAAGYRPEQVDDVYLTHLHPDHVGGAMLGTRRAFPNAIVHVDKHEADYWLDPGNMAKHPEDPRFQAAVLSMNEYIKAGKFQPFDGARELVPGIHAVSAYGHTAGHTNYVVESEGQKLVLWGDLMHVPSVQFAHPEVTIKFDSDSPAAAESRARVFAEAAREGYLVGAAHIPFPGLGHLRAEGQGYVWVPLNYSLIR